MLGYYLTHWFFGWETPSRFMGLSLCAGQCESSVADLMLSSNHKEMWCNLTMHMQGNEISPSHPEAHWIYSTGVLNMLALQQFCYCNHLSDDELHNHARPQPWTSWPGTGYSFSNIYCTLYTVPCIDIMTKVAERILRHANKISCACILVIMNDSYSFHSFPITELHFEFFLHLPPLDNWVEMWTNRKSISHFGTQNNLLSNYGRIAEASRFSSLVLATFHWKSLMW